MAEFLDNACTDAFTEAGMGRRAGGDGSGGESASKEESFHINVSGVTDNGCRVGLGVDFNGEVLAASHPSVKGGLDLISVFFGQTSNGFPKRVVRSVRVLGCDLEFQCLQAPAWC